MVEEFIIRITDDFSQGMDIASGESAGSGGKAKGGKGSGMAGMAAKLGGILAAVTAIASIITEVLSGIIKPLMTMVKQILKLIGELLRPLVEVTMLILRPILLLIKPLIDMFRTFMAPFMDIAREFGRMAQEQMQSGNIAGAIELSIEAVKTIIGPFVVSLVSIALQLVTSLVVGALTGFMNMLITAIGNLIGPIVEFFGGSIEETVNRAKTAVQDGGMAITDTINSGIVIATNGLLGMMKDESIKKLEEARKRYSSTYEGTFIEIPMGALAEANKQMEIEGETIQKTMTDSMTNIGVSVKEKFTPETGSVPTLFNTGLDAMTNAVSNFTDKLKKYADDINKVNLRSSSSSSSSKSWSVSIGGKNGVNINKSVNSD